MVLHARNADENSTCTVSFTFLHIYRLPRSWHTLNDRIVLRSHSLSPCIPRPHRLRCSILPRGIYLFPHAVRPSLIQELESFELKTFSKYYDIRQEERLKRIKNITRDVLDCHRFVHAQHTAKSNS